MMTATVTHLQENTEASSPGLSVPEQVESKDLCAAVKGFVVASDRDSLVSEEKEIEKRYHCSVCDLGFAIARVCETHEMLEHQVPAHWKCGKCGMQFIHGAMFSLHMMRSHHVRSHLCAYKGCWAIFYSKTQLTFHKQQHEKQQQQQQQEDNQQMCEQQQLQPKEDKFLYPCPFCPKAYPHQSKLNYHMRKHTGETPYRCTLCPKTFRLSSERTKHVRNFHIRDRNHLCDWCGKKFICAEALRRHSRSHTGEKPFACPYCPRAFSKSNTRLVHVRQHTGEKPYVCDQCGQSFTVRVSLRTHLKSKHNVIVDTSMYRRREEPGVDQNCLPPIGRPKKKDRVKAT